MRPFGRRAGVYALGVLSLITTGLPTAALAANNNGAKMTTAFPAVGHTYRANFNDGMILVDLQFGPDGQHMTFTDVGSKIPGMKGAETISYTAVEIRPSVYMVHWQEADKMTVVHIEDFERGEVYTNITSPNGDFWNMKGTLTKVS